MAKVFKKKISLNKGIEKSATKCLSGDDIVNLIHITGKRKTSKKAIIHNSDEDNDK